ncbi:MAG: hypothetical protein R2737_17495 [Candidatus Nanopelagicales bacterium]
MAATSRWCRVPAWRAGRGLVVGTAAVGLASAGHSLGGGHVDPAALALWLGVGVVAATLLSDRVWSLPRLIGLLAVTQVVLHVGLGQHAGAGHGGTPTATMLAGHAVAVVLTALVLRRGEALVEWLVATLTRPLRAASLATSPVPAYAATPVARGPVATGAPLRHAVVRRGPPGPRPAHVI